MQERHPAEAGNGEKALGLAPAILTNGGVVKGKRVAADISVAALLRRKEAQFTAQPLEVDDKLMTAAGAGRRNTSATPS